jgi:hypothetical protein
MPRRIPVFRKTMLFILASGLVLFMFPHALHADSGKKAIVIPAFFDASGKEFPELGEALRALLTDALAESPNISIVERERLDTAVNESKMALTGMVDPDTAVKMGALVGARYVILGTVTKAAIEKSGFAFLLNARSEVAKVELSARVVDVESGVTIGTAKGSGSTNRTAAQIITNTGKTIGTGTKASAPDLIREAAQKAIKELAQGILKSFPTEGYILKYDGKRVMIDLAKGMAEPGMVFNVERQGEEIIHPVTGKSLGHVKINVAKIKVTETGDQFSYADVLEKQSDPVPGDKISLVK